jgi:hypothetical protein
MIYLGYRKGDLDSSRTIEFDNPGENEDIAVNGEDPNDTTNTHQGI